MHIITIFYLTHVRTRTYPAAKISEALAFVKHLRTQGIEYTHIFED